MQHDIRPRQPARVPSSSSRVQVLTLMIAKRKVAGGTVGLNLLLILPAAEAPRARIITRKADLDFIFTSQRQEVLDPQNDAQPSVDNRVHITIRSKIYQGDLMLKHCFLVLILAGLVYAIPLSAVAQDTGGGDEKSAPAGAPPERSHFDPAKRTERLGKELKLSSDQKAKVEDILKSEQSQMQNLRADSSLSREDRHSKMMDIHKASDDQIRALLNSDQQKKWEAMQEKRQQRMERHHRGGQQPGATPPSSESQSNDRTTALPE